MAIALKLVLKLLKVTKRTITIWLKKGKLPGYKLGSGRGAGWRVNKSDLYYFMRKHANIAQLRVEQERWKSFLAILDNADIDNEPLTAEEKGSLREAGEDIKAGRTVSFEEVMKEYGIKE